MAAKAMIDQRGGRLVELCHSGGRNIKFSIGTTEYAFDPNRMFYDVAAKQSLEDQGGSSSPSAVAAVRELASLCLAAVKITEPGLLIGAHNNENGTFSILSYRDDPDFRPVAELVHVDPCQDVDNFFFVTERSDYHYVVGKRYNAVLSKARPPRTTVHSVCTVPSREFPMRILRPSAGNTIFRKRCTKYCTIDRGLPLLEA